MASPRNWDTKQEMHKLKNPQKPKYHHVSLKINSKIKKNYAPKTKAKHLQENEKAN